MNELILWGCISAGCLLLSAILFITAIVRKNMKLALFSLIPFVFTGIFGAYAGYLAVTKTYKKVVEEMKPRTADEVYAALFDKPNECVKVNAFQDQIVPRIDTRIWLECSTCPAEVKRILAEYPYKMETVATSTHHSDRTGPNPEWFSTKILGDSVQYYMYQISPNNYREIYLSDSSQMLCIDWAD